MRCIYLYVYTFYRMIGASTWPSIDGLVKLQYLGSTRAVMAAKHDAATCDLLSLHSMFWLSILPLPWLSSPVIIAIIRCIGCQASVSCKDGPGTHVSHAGLVFTHADQRRAGLPVQFLLVYAHR